MLGRRRYPGWCSVCASRCTRVFVWASWWVGMSKRLFRNSVSQSLLMCIRTLLGRCCQERRRRRHQPGPRRRLRPDECLKAGQGRLGLSPRAVDVIRKSEQVIHPRVAFDPLSLLLLPSEQATSVPYMTPAALIHGTCLCPRFIDYQDQVTHTARERSGPSSCQHPRLCFATRSSASGPN
jgi:hypothetical protein